MAKIAMDSTSRYKDTRLLQRGSDIFFDLWEVPLDMDELEDSIDSISYVVTEGDALDKLAWQYYNNQRLGWIIALYNGIIDQIDELVVGQTVIIPSPSLVVKKWAKNARQ